GSRCRPASHRPLLMAPARLALAGSGLMLSAAIAAGPTFRLQPVSDVPLGGTTTRMDYESLDPDRHLLFIAHLGDSAGNVFDGRAQHGPTPNDRISKDD